LKLYGIKNCSSVKKAIEALKSKNMSFEFYDIKKIDVVILDSWLDKRTFQDLINTAGLSARKLNLTKDKILNFNKEELKNMILSNPSLIKRPLIEYKGKIYIGKEYEKFL